MVSAEIARLGVMRLGCARLNYYQPWIKVLIAGVDRTANLRVEGLSITDELNHETNTASFRVSGITPVKGQEVKIYMGDTDLTHQLFGGRILSATQTFEGDLPSRVVWDVNCVDYTWLLKRRKVTKKYANQSASTIIADLITNFSSGFTAVHVQAGMATLDEITFTNEDLDDAISRVMDRVGGYWYADFTPDIHAFTSEADETVTITTAVDRGTSIVGESVDLSQVATRVVGIGGGSSAATDVAVGATTLPVDDASWYNASSGGTVECGPQRITYTGVAGTGGAGGVVYRAPISNPTTKLIASASFGSAVPPGWTGYYAFTFVDSAGGETTAGASISGQYTNVTGYYADYSLSSIDTGPTGTTARRVYRTKDGGASTGPYYLVTEIANNSSTTYVDSTTDGNLGSANLPATNTTNQFAVPAGSTTLPVNDLAQFSASGWLSAGEQVIRYTGRSAASGAGDLTGVPASGVGSLTSSISMNAEAVSIPHLTGIPASGAGSILYAINNGDPVNLVVTVNDTTAQTAMAGFVGGDGIHEYPITDGRLSETEMIARCTAELTKRKDPISTVSLTTRDQSQMSGRLLSFALTSPAITGTRRIQSVTISDFVGGPSPTVFPLRTVVASSARFSFSDLLRQIRGDKAV